MVTVSNVADRAGEVATGRKPSVLGEGTVGRTRDANTDTLKEL